MKCFFEPFDHMGQKSAICNKLLYFNDARRNQRARQNHMSLLKNQVAGWPIQVGSDLFNGLCNNRQSVGIDSMWISQSATSEAAVRSQNHVRTIF